MAKILDGKEVTATILQDCATKVSNKISTDALAPKLSIISVGDNSSNASYIKAMQKAAAETGCLFEIHEFDEDIDKQKIIELIEDLNGDDKTDGILLLRPLPGELRQFETEICEVISEDKDVDAACQLSVAGAYLGNNAFAPCTAESCMEILHHYGIEIEGKRACVVGRSLVVGKPVANMLLNENATVTICHSKTKNMSSITKKADIVIVATGTPKQFGAKYFSEGQVVIDAGINYDEVSGKLCGDVNFEEVKSKVAAITPVPGGVGSVTTAIILKHTIN